jgi:hypothetical protein
MTARLVSAGSALVVSSDALTPDVVQALPLSLLWCEAVARSQGRPIGTSAFFDAVSAEMGRIAWIATDAGVTRYTASGEQPDPGLAVLAMAEGLVPAGQLADLSLLFAGIAGARAGDPLDTMLTAWWARRQSAQGTVFAAVPAGINNNLQLEATLIQLDFAVSAAGWRSFFLSRLQSGTRAVARHVALTLNDRLWTQIEDEVSRKLGQAAIASIQSIQL